MGISWPTKSTGDTLLAADWNNARLDLIAGKFFDSSGTGSNYLQALHNGTDGKIDSSLGHLALNTVTGSTVKMSVNNTTILTAAAALLTAAQALKVPDGSVGTPSVHFAGDVDTGMALISSKLALIFGGAVKLNNDGTTWDAQGQAITTTANISATGTGVVTGAGGVKCKAAGAGSTTLDWYEEGTWTPAINGSTGNGTVTETGVGFFTRVGNVVAVSGFLSISVVTAHPTGSLRIAGLPYVCNNTSGGRGGSSVSRYSALTLPATTYGLLLSTTQNVSYFNLYTNANTGATTLTDVNATIGAGFLAEFSVVYLTTP